MKQDQGTGNFLNRLLRLAGWLLAALVLLAAGNALLDVVKSGQYVFDIFIASLLWPLGLMLATRKWTLLFRILRVFFGLLAAYALIAVSLSLLGYQDLVETYYLWAADSPIHLLPGGLQALSVLAASFLNQRWERTQTPGNQASP